MDLLSQRLPLEIVNKILIMRPRHPVAQLILDDVDNLARYMCSGLPGSIHLDEDVLFSVEMDTEVRYITVAGDRILDLLVDGEFTFDVLPGHGKFFTLVVKNRMLLIGDFTATLKWTGLLLDPRCRLDDDIP